MTSAPKFYWRLSAIRCVAAGVYARPPLSERVRFTLRWCLRERRAVRVAHEQEGGR